MFAMHAQTNGRIWTKLGMKDPYPRGRSSGGRERFSAWREAPARLFGRKMSRRAPLRNKQSQNLAPSMDESEQIAQKVIMNDREMKLELASEAVGRGCPAMWVTK